MRITPTLSTTRAVAVGPKVAGAARRGAVRLLGARRERSDHVRASSATGSGSGSGTRPGGSARAGPGPGPPPLRMGRGSGRGGSPVGGQRRAYADASWRNHGRHPRQSSLVRSTQGTALDVVDGDSEEDAWYERWVSKNVTEVFTTGELLGELTRAKDSLVVVYFFQPSCHACKALHPKLAQLARDTLLDDVRFLKVHFQKHEELCHHLDVTQLPLFRLYKGSRGLIASFTASVATFQRLRGAVEREKNPMCSRGKRRVSTRLSGAPKRLSTKEMMVMKVAMKRASDGTCLALPSLEATRWINRLDQAHQAAATDAAATPQVDS